MTHILLPVSILAAVYTLFQVLLLQYSGMPIPTAWIAGIIYGLLLVATCALVINILKFYQPRKNEYGYALVITIGFAMGWITLSNYVLVQVYRGHPQITSLIHKSTLVTLLAGFLMTGWTWLISKIWYVSGEQENRQERQQASEKLARDAELFKLRQQMNPHFLFNSLNSISALMLSRPDEARDMIYKLSDFLRGTLKKEEQLLVTLSEEMQYLQLYLDIEKVRFGHRLMTDIQVSHEASSMKLPSLLLQPVVENAIKFGLYDTASEVVIRITAEKENEELVLCVENPFDPETVRANQGTGFGLAAVRRRLYLLYARHDLLEATTHDNIFTTCIKIPVTHDQSDNH